MLPLSSNIEDDSICFLLKDTDKRFLARELLMLLAISIGDIPFLYSFTAPSGKVISIISVNLFQKYGL